MDNIFLVRYKDDTVVLGLEEGKIYKVESIIDGFYEIIDENKDHSLWYPQSFEIISGGPDDVNWYTTE